MVKIHRMGKARKHGYSGEAPLVDGDRRIHILFKEEFL